MASVALPWQKRALSYHTYGLRATGGRLTPRRGAQRRPNGAEGGSPRWRARRTSRASRGALTPAAAPRPRANTKAAQVAVALLAPRRRRGGIAQRSPATTRSPLQTDSLASPVTASLAAAQHRGALQRGDFVRAEGGEGGGSAAAGNVCCLVPAGAQRSSLLFDGVATAWGRF